jgi:two-component system, chemotaxis family, CheB/CheR fusion protein
MTVSQPAAKNGWIGLQNLNGDVATADTSATDLIALLDAVDVPIVVIARDFTVASFNQAAADVLGFTPSHIGLSPRDVPALVGQATLQERCAEIIAGGVACRIDLRIADTSFVARIAPYAQSGSQVGGAVLTFMNVTAFRASIDQAIYEREYTKAILNTVAEPIVVLGADHRVQSGNRAFHTIFRVSRDEPQRVSLYELADGAFELPRLRAQLNALLAGGTSFDTQEVDFVLPDVGPRTLCLDARPLSFPGRADRGVLLTFQDITAHKKAEQVQRMLIGELQHRVKNTLATVQAIASQTFNTAGAAERQAFTARLQAVSNAHDVLTQDNWARAPLDVIVHRALEPFQRGRIALNGPYVPLEASKALAMTMALHELATNAVKYGALSTDAGRVRLDWSLKDGADGSYLQMVWEERGGPAVQPPQRKGFGSRLIEASLDKSHVSYAPAGLSCTLEMAL